MDARKMWSRIKSEGSFFTLPSGAEVMIRPIMLHDYLARADLPNGLLQIVAEMFLMPADEVLSREAEDAVNRAKELNDFISFVIGECLLVPSPEGPEGLDMDSIPMQDRLAIFKAACSTIEAFASALSPLS